MQESLKQAKRVHIVGVGGIGISALARLLRHQGKEVSGCDRTASELGEALAREGISVSLGHAAEHVSPDIDLLIYSDAIPSGNPERLRAEELGIPTLSYFEALGEATEGYDLIAVAGTHGKTTTTALLADILEEAKLDPTVVVGSLRTKTGTNFRPGESRYFLVEADEYMRHFLHLSPRVLVITNIDRDHLDYYKDLADIQSAFRALAEKVPADGYIVASAADPHILPVLGNVKATVVDYTMAGEVPALKFPGKHNRANARAALAAARVLGVADDVALPALASFEGTARRFEFKGETKAGTFV
ncbi:MAG TPA: Mur ligase family protein, partial [Candidatus Paceibacterota bacterium]|nr:Mur ligase family protein [Candidatus Paceibacterota bacterium]